MRATIIKTSQKNHHRFSSSLLMALAIIMTTAMLLTTAGCGAPRSDKSPTQGETNQSQPISVVASINQWGILAQELGGDQVKVTSILKNIKVDAHEFSPTSADLATISQAELLLVNGAGYDSWATKSTSKSVTTVNAASTIGAEEGDNPHLWFSSEVRNKMAVAIRDAYINARPAKKVTFTKLYKAWSQKESSLDKKLKAFAKDHKDRPYAATESVAYYLLADMGMKDATPQAYSRAIQNESEPSANDLSDFQSLIEKKKIDFLVTNPQEASDASNLLMGTAGKSGVPTVEITEQVPDKYKTQTDWIGDLVNAISQKTSAADGTDSAAPSQSSDNKP